MSTSRLFPLSLCLLLSLLACGESSPLSDSAWIAKGVPNPNHPWNGTEMGSAGKILSGVYQTAPESLPRYVKGNNSNLFARINSLENFAFFDKDSIPIQERLMTGTELIQAYVPIYMLYANAAMSGKPYTQELTEMMISLLSIEEKLAGVIKAFIATVPKERQESEQFQGGMKQMRAGIVQSANGIITVLRDKGTFSAAQLEQMSAAAKRIMPSLLAFLDEDSRSQLRAEAETTIAATDNAVVKKDLRDIFPESR